MKKISRKIILTILSFAIGGNMLYAGPTNYVSIVDIKDALYYLIKDYQKLLKNSNNNTEKIKQLRKEINEEFRALKITIKKRNITVDKEIKELFKEVNNLNKKYKNLKNNAILLPNKNDAYTKYIDNYVEKNKDIANEIENN